MIKNLFNSYKKFQNVSFNYCNCNPVAVFTIISEFTEMFLYIGKPQGIFFYDPDCLQSQDSPSLYIFNVSIHVHCAKSKSWSPLESHHKNVTDHMVFDGVCIAPSIVFYSVFYGLVCWVIFVFSHDLSVFFIMLVKIPFWYFPSLFF